MVIFFFIITLMVTLFFLWHQTPNLYSEDSEVIALASRVVPIYCLYMFTSASMHVGAAR